MSTQFQSVFDAALLLPESERGELAARLMDTLEEKADSDLDEDGWGEELHHRIDDIASGRVETVPLEVVLRHMQEDIDAGLN